MCACMHVHVYIYYVCVGVCEGMSMCVHVGIYYSPDIKEYKHQYFCVCHNAGTVYVFFYLIHEFSYITVKFTRDVCF